MTKINPQVPGTSSSLSKQLLRQWHLPRVGSAMPQANPNQLPMCGTSAFAFQGTNAHIIQQQTPYLQSQLPVSAATAWQRQCHWVAPPLSALIGSLMSVGTTARKDTQGAGMLVMQVDLTGARAAFLRQYCVMQNALMPAAGFAQLCSAAAAVMAQSSDTSGNGCHLLIVLLQQLCATCTSVLRLTHSISFACVKVFCFAHAVQAQMLQNVYRTGKVTLCWMSYSSNGVWFAGLVFQNAVLPAALPLSQLCQESAQVVTAVKYSLHNNMLMGICYLNNSSSLISLVCSQLCCSCACGNTSNNYSVMQRY